MARPLPGLRRVEHARRGAPRARGRPPRRRRPRGAPRAARPGPARRRAGRPGRAPARPGSASSTACSAAASCPGSLVLLGGSPGIGKSTLTSMALGNLAGAGRRTLYVSGEESAAQIKLRAERLPGAALDVPVLAETDLDTVLATLEAERPEVCVIDSVQTLHAGDLTGAAGSVGPGARGRRPDHAARQGARHRRPARRPRHQGGRARRPARARAPRRLRAPVRGRARAHLPHACARSRTASARRARPACSRCARAGSSRSRTRAPASSARPRARPAASCSRRWRARGRCWSRSRRSCRRPSWCRRGAIANGIDRNRLALVLAVLGAPRGRRRRQRRRVRQRRGRRAGRRARRRPGGRARGRERRARRRAPAAGERPLACFGEIGLTGELRSVAHPERRLAEAAQVRPGADGRPGRRRPRRDRGARRCGRR